MSSERCVVFPGRQGPLIGILGLPIESRAAVLIVAGQPQTRHGSHRMFTRLARQLSASGIATLRFDCGGWGDSPGNALAFEDSATDIGQAAMELMKAVPLHTPLVIAGLCDGASAAVLALPSMNELGLRPAALCLINPWVRSDATLNEAMVKTWYLRRITDPLAWRSLFSGAISAVSLKDFVIAFYKQLRVRFSTRSPSDDSPAEVEIAGTSLPDQMLGRLLGYGGNIWTILSGRDLTAGELDSLVKRDARWKRLIDSPNRLCRVPAADHTFSDPNDWIAAGRWLTERTLSLVEVTASK